MHFELGSRYEVMLLNSAMVMKSDVGTYKLFSVAAF